MQTWYCMAHDSFDSAHKQFWESEYGIEGGGSDLIRGVERLP